MPLILEGLVTTINTDQSVNLAPMGPIVDREVTRLTLRPFKSSRTYANLRTLGEGVFHVTDDVELLARAAIGQVEPLPAMFPAKAVSGVILADACRWFAFRVRELDERADRTRIECDVVDRGQQRDFFGFNRAKHAVLEAAILATRIGILPAAEIRADFERLKVIVDKTAGDQEQRAWGLLEAYVSTKLARDQET